MTTLSKRPTSYKRPSLYTGVLAFFMLLCYLCGCGEQGQGLPPTMQNIAGQTSNISEQVKSLSERVDTIAKDLKRVEDESKKKSKDFWDKLAALSGWFTGGFVGLIGLLATYFYNKRSNKVAQVQTISSLISHLQTIKNQKEKENLIP